MIKKLEDCSQVYGEINQKIVKSLGRRYLRERMFCFFGQCSIAVALIFLFSLLLYILWGSFGALRQGYLTLHLEYTEQGLGLPYNHTPQDYKNVYFRPFILEQFSKAVEEDFSSLNAREISAILGFEVDFLVQDHFESLKDPFNGETYALKIPLFGKAAVYFQQGRELSETQDQLLSEKQIGWLERLYEKNLITYGLNYKFFTLSDSRNPEGAGIFNALVGSLFVLATTFLFSFPLGVGAAIYLEELAPKNKFTYFIEININNLASVPSIIFGILGLVVFIQFFHLPRSSALVGGMVLALLTLPTIIIASRAALRSVPDSILHAAYALGASKMQVIFHYSIPLAMPGIVTGVVIGMAGAMGETAPLIIIGMAAFIPEVATGLLDPTAVLSTQIFHWSDAAERGFEEKASAGILVFILFLVIMNFFVFLVRKKYQRKL